jgi:hypothetical protein
LNILIRLLTYFSLINLNDKLIFHTDVFFVMKRNFLYVKCWPEQSKKDAALQVALLMAVPPLGVLLVNEDTI